MQSFDSNIVEVDWLFKHFEDPNLIVLDATMKKQPNGELIATSPIVIQGAKAFNFDTDICDQSSQLPHMLPTETHFQKAINQLEIYPDSRIVIYDAMGMFSAPRAWWMFRFFGHTNVAVLNGGLPAWANAGFPVDTNYANSKAKSVPQENDLFQVIVNHVMCVDLDQVKSAIKDSKVQIIDARSFGRFNGTEPEPRTELKSGHIPSSSSLPFTQLLDGGKFLSKKALSYRFQTIINKNAERIIFTCGSGVTAGVLALAATEVGYKKVQVYDGSWSEWASQNDALIETSMA